LRLEDIGSERMVIHIRKGKGGKDRDVPLCLTLLDILPARVSFAKFRKRRPD
jgi:integrase